MKGQFGQPMMIEKVLKNNKFWKKNSKSKKQQGFFIEAGARYVLLSFFFVKS